MTGVRATAAREVLRISDRKSPVWDAARAELGALEAVADAARERRCNRFDVTPCSERPEINPDEWCSMCAALARLVAVQDGQTERAS